MTEHDYAAPLKQERRKSVWASITRSLYLTTDWGSTPPLTAGLKERFPGLLRNGTPIQNSLSEASAAEALLPGRPTAASNNSRQPHTDSVQEVNTYSTHQRSPTGRSQRNTYGRLSRKSPLEHATHQQDGRGPHIRSEETPPKLPSVRSHSPLWNAHLYEDPRPAPAASPVTTLPQAQQQRNTGHTIYHRNAHGRLVPATQVTRPSLVNSIRRRPVQFSLLNQSNKDDIAETDDSFRPSRSVDPVVPTTSSSSGYSHVPVYSPLSSIESHILPQPLSHSSSAARYIHSYDQSQTSSLRTTNVVPSLSSPSPTLVELQTDFPFSSNAAELQGSLQYDPPDFSHVPLLPRAAFARRSSAVHEESTTSLATFESPNPSSRPLNLLEANIVGLKQHVKSGLGDRQSWKTKAIHLGNRIKYHSRLLWDTDDDRVKKFNARCDVWAFGPLHDCMCGICVKKRGEDPATADRVAHEMPCDSPWPWKNSRNGGQ